MSGSPFQSAPPWQGALRSLAIPASVLFHVGVAWLMLQERPPEEPHKDTWVEMEIVEPPPPPPPPPEPPEPPPPEPPKPKPPPKPVEFHEIPPEPQPTDRPPEPNKELRRVQGLSASSFAENGTSGLSMRAGTTLQTAASKETLTIDQASSSTAVNFASVTTQPRLKSCPPLEVPQIVRDAKLEGTVMAVLDIGTDGGVTAVRITAGLSPEADAACVQTLQGCRFKPGEQDGTAVAVTSFPRRCRIQAIE